MGNIGKELAKTAAKAGICREWGDMLKGTDDIDALIEMYVKGIDFCLKNEFPSNGYIRANFKGKMEAHGVHLDEVLDLENCKKLVALGNCSGKLNVTGYAVCEVFLKHTSRLELKATNNVFVMVDMFDDTELDVFADIDAKVCVNRYGGKLSTKVSGNAYVKLIEKHKTTY